MNRGALYFKLGGSLLLALLISGGLVLLSGHQVPDEPTPTGLTVPPAFGRPPATTELSQGPSAAECPDDAEVAVLRQKVARLQVEIDHWREAADASSAVEAPAERAQKGDEEGQDDPHGVFEQAARAFQQEPLDPVWSAETIAQITAALQQPRLAALPVADIDCRSTRCRLIVGDEAEPPRGAQLALLGLALGADLPEASFSPREEGAGQVVVFLAKATSAGQASGR